MSAPAPMPTPHRRRAARHALPAMIALAGASLLLLLNHFQIGPQWAHWVLSLVAVAAALGVVAMAELTWQRAVNSAASAGLVARSAGGDFTPEPNSPRQRA